MNKLSMLCTTGVMATASCMAAGAFANEAPPVTKDALADRIRQYHKANDCDGFIGLFYEQDGDAPRHAAFVESMTNYVCSNFGRPVDRISFQKLDADTLAKPKDFKGAHSEYTLRPEGAAVIDYGSSGPGETTSLSLLYGKEDGKYYLITTKPTAQP